MTGAGSGEVVTWVIVVSAAVATVPALVLYGLRARLDRRRTVPPWIFPALMVGGGVGGALFSIYGSVMLEVWLAEPLARMPLLHEAFVVPLAEEFGKGLVVLPLVFGRWMRSTVDGLLYGFAAGAGFAVVEGFVWLVGAWVGGGEGAWAAQVVVRTLPAVIIHGGATALLGAAIGDARMDHRSLVVAVAPVVGLACAVTVHGTWNALVSLAAFAPRFGALAWGALPVFVAMLGLAVRVSMADEDRDLERVVRFEVARGRLDPVLAHVVLERRHAPRLRAALIGLAYAQRHAAADARAHGRVWLWDREVERLTLRYASG